MELIFATSSALGSTWFFINYKSVHEWCRAVHLHIHQFTRHFLVAHWRIKRKRLWLDNCLETDETSCVYYFVISQNNNLRNRANIWIVWVWMSIHWLEAYAFLLRLTNSRHVEGALWWEWCFLVGNEVDLYVPLCIENHVYSRPSHCSWMLGECTQASWLSDRRCEWGEGDWSCVATPPAINQQSPLPSTFSYPRASDVACDYGRRLWSGIVWQSRTHTGKCLSLWKLIWTRFYPTGIKAVARIG